MRGLNKSSSVITGCTVDGGFNEGPESNRMTTSQEISERGGGENGSENGSAREGDSERGGGKHGGSGGESGRESGGESAASGSEEGSGATLAKDEIFDAVPGGARLVMGYAAANNAFTGTVENTTSSALSNVRIEVHLSNGTELGPTTLWTCVRGRCMRLACLLRRKRSQVGYRMPRLVVVKAAAGTAADAASDAEAAKAIGV